MHFGRNGWLAGFLMVGKFVVAWGILIGSVSLWGCGTNFNNAGKTLQDEPPKRFVTINFANVSDTEAVNVDFYVSYDRLDAMPGALFVAGHYYTEGVGVAGTGVVEPRSTDTIVMDCTDLFSIGTTGGRFVDGETGESLGAGAPRWLQEGPLAICDGEVTFAYRSEAGGFNTTIVLKN